MSFPALPASGRPWVRINSCNPAEIKDPEVPPVFSGYPSADRTGWAEYWDEYRRVHGELHASFSEFCVQRGAPPLPELDFIHTSPDLNLYLYPEVVDYRRAETLPATWHNLGASVRATDAPWDIPAEIAGGDGALLYLSLGSLGSGDVALMQTLIDTLGASGHRVVVSMGSQHEQLRLGEAMVLLPLFWDQYDNAQRIHESGLGLRLDTYGHAPEQLLGAIDALLADRALADRLGAVSHTLRASPGTARAADLIEALASRPAQASRTP